MKKAIIRSFLVALMLIGILDSKALAAESGQQSQMSVIPIKLSLYKDNPNYSSNLERTAELSFNDKVTVVTEEGNAAKIRTADGKEGWVYKDYLSSNLSEQTWLVKEGRNLRDGPSTSYNKIESIPDNSKVFVLDYHPETNFYKIQTVEGHQGWIYGYYQEEVNNVLIDYGQGNNVIPYNIEQLGTFTNKITLFTPLNTTAYVTVNQIDQYINFKLKGAKSNMSNMGSTYLEAQNAAGLNAVYLLAHSGLESKWGTSGIVDQKYNFYGINAIDLQPAEGAYTYASARDGIIAGAIFINRTYVSRDKSKNELRYPFPQPTLDNMRFNSGLHQYATDEAWAGKIANLAKEFADFTTATGWKNWDGKWYFFKNEGIVQTGWLLDGGKWYYLDTYGVMQTGWKFIDGKWYFLTNAGDMKIGWVNSGGKWYFLDTSGAMKTGWVSTGGQWYYLNNSGVMQTGWVWDNGKWYYLYSDGHMAANTTIGRYRLGKDGAMI